MTGRAALAQALVALGAAAITAGAWLNFGMGVGLIVVGLLLAVIGLLFVDVDPPSTPGPDPSDEEVPRAFPAPFGPGPPR